MQGYRVFYEPEAVSAAATDVTGGESRVSSWQQQYFDGVYYGVILADTVVPVWALYGKHAGAVSGAAIDISEGWEHCPFGTDHDDR